MTYYDDSIELINQDEQRRLISLWMDNWRDRGFEPHVITAQHAARLPGYDDFVKRASEYHSSNPPGYDLSCLVRWFAVGQLGDPFSIMADYDLFSFGWLPPKAALDWEQEPIEGLKPKLPPLTIWQGHVPCLVTGPKEEFAEQAKKFIRAPAFREHTSDMTLLAGPAGVDVKKIDVVKMFNDPGWETADVVHFSNASMTPAGRQPKHQWIPQLRKWKGMQ